MSFWMAFPLPCQPRETDLGRGLDPLTCLRGGLCQSTGGSLSSMPPAATPWGSPARALTKVGNLLGCAAASPGLANSFGDCLDLSVLLRSQTLHAVAVYL